MCGFIRLSYRWNVDCSSCVQVRVLTVRETFLGYRWEFFLMRFENIDIGCGLLFILSSAYSVEFNEYTAMLSNII